MNKFIQNIITQLITFQSYEELKLVFFLNNDKEYKDWEYVKMLPHVWDNTKQIRFFASDFYEMKVVSKYLEEEFEKRKAQSMDLDYKSFMPYYLIITDDYKSVESLKIFDEVLKSKVNLGFSILCTTKDLVQLPNECKTFIDLRDDEGTLFDSEFTEKSKRDFIFSSNQTVYYDRIYKEISNIPIKYHVSKEALLPDTYNFLEMYNVGTIEQLNILERWNNNDSCISLVAPVGINGYGNIISIDIHEKFHGPHGLIAGSTGSRKK